MGTIQIISDNLLLNISLKTAQETEDATNLFITTVQNAAWAATPTITVKIRNEINIPNEIRELVREKR